jgi:hypothetical protein
MLLGILADVFFGERGKGPKPRWDSEAIKQLILDFDRLSATLPKINQMTQFELLISLKPKRYEKDCSEYCYAAGATPQALMQSIADALNLRGALLHLAH